MYIIKKVNSFVLCLSLLGSLSGQCVKGVEKGGASLIRTRINRKENKTLKNSQKLKISALQEGGQRSPLEENLQKFLSEYWKWLLLPPSMTVIAVIGYKLKKHLEKISKSTVNKEAQDEKIKDDVKKKEKDSKEQNKEAKIDTKPEKIDDLEDQKAVEENVINNEVKKGTNEEEDCTSDEDFWGKDRTPLTYGLDRYWVLYIVSKKYGEDSKIYKEVEKFFDNEDPETFCNLKIFIRGICRLNFASSLIWMFVFIVLRVTEGDKKTPLCVLGFSSSVISMLSPTFGKILSLVCSIAAGCREAKTIPGKVAGSVVGSLGSFVLGCGAPIFIMKNE